MSSCKHQGTLETQAPRPAAPRRSDYVATGQADAFIVPVLRRQIEYALAEFGTPAPQQGRVLDIGCGSQPFRKHLEAIGYKYIGLDIQQNLEGSVDITCSIDDESIAPELGQYGPFDLILCTEVMEHVADWRAAFRNLARLTRPGGRIVITCPHFYMLHEEPYDFWRPTPHILRYFAVREGLDVAYQEAGGDGWDVLGTLLGSCHPSAVDRRLISRGLAICVRFGRRILYSLLWRRYMQRYVKLPGFYISNVVVLSQPLK